MYCPKCKNEYLKPTKLEDGLPVMGCQKCDGALLSLLYYRDWVERVSFDCSTERQSPGVLSDSDTTTAMCCPKCSRLMTKYSVSGSLHTRLDLCSSCDEAWLDGGEWKLLKSLELAQKLPSVFTDQWQRRVRGERTEYDRIDRLKKAVGESDAEKAVEVKKWFRDNPNKSTIVHYLNVE